MLVSVRHLEALAIQNKLHLLSGIWVMLSSDSFLVHAWILLIYLYILDRALWNPYLMVSISSFCSLCSMSLSDVLLSFSSFCYRNYSSLKHGAHLSQFTFSLKPWPIFLLACYPSSASKEMYLSFVHFSQLFPIEGLPIPQYSNTIAHFSLLFIFSEKFTVV